jgi:hypothetical protein
MKPQFPCLFQLFPKLIRIDQLGKRHLNGAADERKRSASLRELLPNELEHQQLVKIGIEQRPCNRVQFPVMVMRSPREVDDHNATTLPHSERSSGRSPVRRGVVPYKASKEVAGQMCSLASGIASGLLLSDIPTDFCYQVPRWFGNRNFSAQNGFTIHAGSVKR